MTNNELDTLLDGSHPRAPPHGRGIEHELALLAKAHANRKGTRAGASIGQWIPRHRNAVFAALALAVFGGASAAAAAPAITSWYEGWMADLTTDHAYPAADKSFNESCTIDWKVLPSNDETAAADPAVLAARDYLLTLDLSTVTTNPIYLEGMRNPEGTDDTFVPASDGSLEAAAFTHTVADVVFAEVTRQGFDYQRVSVEVEPVCSPETND